jgi:hypothetical protein
MYNILVKLNTERKIVSFDEFYDEIDDVDEYFDNQLQEYSMESLEWHKNIFKFLNPSNVLYIPDQHYMV